MCRFRSLRSLDLAGFSDRLLGVECTYCHVQGDFATDANPKKDMARKMIAMVRLIDTTFPSSAGVYPEGYHEVDCITCHRGNTKPETKAPSKFYNRANSLGEPPFEQRPAVSLKLLPANTPVHGSDSLMGDFRDALNVDCSYCHGGGKPLAQSSRSNPTAFRR